MDDGRAAHYASLAQPALDWLYQPRNTEPGWLLPDLTRLVGRMHPGTVTVVAGRPGAGKTTLLGQQVDALAAAGHGVTVVPTETSGAIWRVQSACRSLGLAWEHVLEEEWHLLPDGARDRLADHLRWQTGTPEGRRVHVLDQDRVTTGDFLETIAQAAEISEHHTVLLDYVQNVEGILQRESLETFVREVASAAKAYGVHVILASQLRRPDERDPLAEYMPASLGSLAGTAALEHTATTVLMLHRGLKTDLVEGDLVSVRRGQKPVTDVVEPGCMVVNVLKNRQKGNVGAQVRAYIHQGTVYPDRDSWQQAAFHTQQAVDAHLLEEHLDR